MLVWIQPIMGAVIGIAAISWLLYFYFKGRREAIKALCEVDTTFEVTCSKCNNTYEVAPKDFINISNFKIQKSKYVRSGFVGSSQALSLQRYCPCPYCKRDELASFKDVDKVAALDKEIAWPIMLKYGAIGLLVPKKKKKIIIS